MTKIRSIAGIAAIGAGFGAASLAETAPPFDAPARVDIWGECTPIYAVQKESCTVENFYVCGDQILSASFESGAHQINILRIKDGRELKNWGGDADGNTEWAAIDIGQSEGAFSLDSLIQSGRIPIRETAENYDPGETEPVMTNTNGEVATSGKTVQLDGVEFMVVESDMIMTFLGIEERLVETLYLDPIKRTVLRGDRHVYGSAFDLDFALTPQKLVMPEAMSNGPVTAGEFDCDTPAPHVRMTEPSTKKDP